MKKIAVVVPGIMGSELWWDNKLIWPGPVTSLVLPYNKMADLLRPDLKVGDLIRSYSFSAQYETLIADLHACGYDAQFVCPYDWRKPNEQAAARLADLLDKTIAAHADAEVSLIAHSMGGLVSRYYLESGAYAGRPGFAAVRRLITLGTPHNGAPLALTAALGMERRLFLNAKQVRDLVSKDDFPSLYQLLPPPGEPFCWDDHPKAEFLPVDVYDKKVAAAINLNQNNLESARKFHGKLNLANKPANVRYFFFAGSRQVTISTVRLRTWDKKEPARRIETEDSGDGTVPIWSALGAAVQNSVVGGEHGTIYQDTGLRRTLAALLGAPGVLAAAPIQVDLSIRDRVVEPDQDVHAALTFPSGVTSIDATLQFERLQLDADGKVVSAAPTGKARVIRYSGTAADKIGIVIQAPEFPGFYRLALTDAGGARLASDDLFVQEPA
ncbi:MAG: hypothetical protein HYZ57_14745 [Acidobacteria bacterium]|nr:hypothetical protein [Acidobacteriota bacterium]MBI3281090.1 hypothetical protein [Acidobacteriota bacterium]